MLAAIIILPEGILPNAHFSKMRKQKKFLKWKKKFEV
jgi:hypothetical protein